MSESNKSNISYVYLRWLQVELHLENIANSSNVFAIDICEYLDKVDTEMKSNREVEKKGFTWQRNRQLTSIHIAAYFLYPENYHVLITVEQQSQLQELFKRFTSDHNNALEQFFDFCGRSGCFAEAGGSWDMTGKPILF
jgi:uncharacterized membrane protein